MSSCIAVACESNSVIVTVTDRKWGSLFSSFEDSIKHAYIAPRWLTMLAGDDISVAGERVIGEMRDTFKADDLPLDISSARMCGVLDRAWNTIQHQIAATSVLGPLGLSMSDFLQSRSRLGEDTFRDLVHQIYDKSKLQLELLVCGFDDTKVPVMLIRTDEFSARDVSRLGRAAIGSGYAAALASLAFHKYVVNCSLSEGIYQACAAKFLSEQADGVGDDTIVVCLRNDGQACWLFGSAIRHIRSLWERSTKPKMPPKEKTVELIQPMTVGRWINL